MKKCDYCGRDNPEEAAQCHECGKKFGAERPEQHPTVAESLNQLIAPRLKWALWSAAWGAVILETLLTSPSSIITAPWFPLGLVALLPNGEERAIIAWMLGFPVVVLGWAVYILLSVVIDRTRKQGTFILTYMVLCTLLVLNVAGCKKTLEAAAGIH